MAYRNSSATQRKVSGKYTPAKNLCGGVGGGFFRPIFYTPFLQLFSAA
jgi:hypothetical protein